MTQTCARLPFFISVLGSVLGRGDGDLALLCGARLRSRIPSVLPVFFLSPTLKSQSAPLHHSDPRSPIPFLPGELFLPFFFVMVPLRRSFFHPFPPPPSCVAARSASGSFTTQHGLLPPPVLTSPSMLTSMSSDLGPLPCPDPSFPIAPSRVLFFLDSCSLSVFVVLTSFAVFFHTPPPLTRFHRIYSLSPSFPLPPDDPVRVDTP